MFYFRLRVRLNFITPREKTRVRINREVSRLKRREEKLKQQLKSMQQHVWRLQKKLQRKSTPQSTVEVPKPSTPVKEAEALMRSDGFTPRKHSKMRRQLIAQASLIAHTRTLNRKARKDAVRSASQTMSARLLARCLKVGQKPMQNKST